MRRADHANRAPRLQSFELGDTALPRHQIVHLVNIHPATEVAERCLDLSLGLGVIRRPDFGGDDCALPTCGQSPSQHSLGFALHERRVEHGCAVLEGRVDNRATRSTGSGPPHIEGLPRSYRTEGIYISYSPSLDNPTQWSTPVKILNGGKWYPQVLGVESGSGTDKIAGEWARFYMMGTSHHLLHFIK